MDQTFSYNVHRCRRHKAFDGERKDPSDDVEKQRERKVYKIFGNAPVNEVIQLERY